LAQKGCFPMLLKGMLIVGPKGPQMAEICFQKGFRPGFGPGRAFQLPQKCASKEPAARIWAKMAVSQWAQKSDIISRSRDLKWQKCASNRALGQDLAQKGRFRMVPEEKFNSRPRGRQMAESCFQTAPGQDLAQKGRFPMVPDGNFHCRPQGPQMAVLDVCLPHAPQARGCPSAKREPRVLTDLALWARVGVAACSVLCPSRACGPNSADRQTFTIASRS
jgi:hypothetical protein